MTNQKDQRIRDLLGSSSVQAMVRRLAKAVYRHLTSLRLPLPGECAGSNCDEETALEELVSEINLFLLNRYSCTDFFTSEPPGIRAGLVRSAFIQHCREHARTRRIDPYRYLYKRAADIFRKSEDFSTKAVDSRRTIFWQDPSARRALGLTKEDLNSIPFPLDSVGLDFSAVNKTKTLHILGKHFLEKVSERLFESPVKADLRDFIEWIFLHVEAPFPRQEKEVNEKVLEDKRASYSFDPEKVREWARCFSSLLNSRQKLVFFLRVGCDKGFEKIALESGHKNASGARYMYEAVLEKLREFLTGLPWLSPGEGDQVNSEAFSFFLETLLGDLKKNLSKPYLSAGENNGV